MGFLVDADMPRSTARALTGAGHTAVHVSEVGLATASDREIFDHAQRTKAVLITRDLDFTDPLKFPEKRHHGLLIVRIRETLPPAFVNGAVLKVVGTLADSEFQNAVIIVEEARFRRRAL
jgi:predicted nuclease of predicted toxin-antitoxin system